MGAGTSALLGNMVQSVNAGAQNLGRSVGSVFSPSNMSTGVGGATAQAGMPAPGSLQAMFSGSTLQGLGPSNTPLPNSQTGVMSLDDSIASMQQGPQTMGAAAATDAQSWWSKAGNYLTSDEGGEMASRLMGGGGGGGISSHEQYGPIGYSAIPVNQTGNRGLGGLSELAASFLGR